MQTVPRGDGRVPYRPFANGCAERFVRLLKEQLLWLRHLETIEELQVAL